MFNRKSNCFDKKQQMSLLASEATFEMITLARLISDLSLISEYLSFCPLCRREKRFSKRLQSFLTSYNNAILLRTHSKVLHT